MIGVLVVEDEPLLLMDTADIFTDAGMAAFVAHDADAAIALLAEREDIYVVITDLAMPLRRMDGHAFVRDVAMRRPDMGVLVLLGADTSKWGDRLPGVRFLPKPSSSRELIGAVLAIVSEQTGSI